MGEDGMSPDHFQDYLQSKSCSNLLGKRSGLFGANIRGISTGHRVTQPSPKSLSIDLGSINTLQRQEPAMYIFKSNPARIECMVTYTETSH